MLREIKPGSAAFETFVTALGGANLPTEDLLSESFRYFSLDDIAWGGFGAGRDALVRSIVVSANARGKGLGAAIVAAIVGRAREEGVERLWLLTTDSAPFFERLNWRIAERSSAPPAISASREFSGLCPTTATLMVRAL